jgi:uncharacterized protein (TIGR02466 family)
MLISETKKQIACNIALLFPTAVGSFESDNHKEYKQIFLERMPDHCIQHESGAGLISGESSGKVYVHTDASLSEFFSFVSRCVEEYLENLAFDISRVDINIVKTWITATDNNTVTPVHCHVTSHLSFVYYMQMPKEADAIMFQIWTNPNEPYIGAFGQSTSRQQSLVLERNALNSNQSILPVHEGQLLVFPSTLYHGTVKMGDMGDETRISLAGDVLLVFNEQSPNYSSGLFDPKTWRKFL